MHLLFSKTARKGNKFFWLRQKKSPLPRLVRGITNKTTKNAVIHIKTSQYSGFYYYGFYFLYSIKNGLLTISARYNFQLWFATMIA